MLKLERGDENKLKGKVLVYFKAQEKYFGIYVSKNISDFPLDDLNNIKPYGNLFILPKFIEDIKEIRKSDFDILYTGEYYTFLGHFSLFPALHLYFIKYEIQNLESSSEVKLEKLIRGIKNELKVHYKDFPPEKSKRIFYSSLGKLFLLRGEERLRLIKNLEDFFRGAPFLKNIQKIINLTSEEIQDKEKIKKIEKILKKINF